MHSRTAAIAVVVVALHVNSGCSQGSDTQSSSSSAEITESSAELSLVAIGDSVPHDNLDACPGCVGFVDQYGEAIRHATGRAVATANLSQMHNFTVPKLLAQLPNWEDELTHADAIIVGIAHNSIPLNDDEPCGSPFDEATQTIEDWSKIDAQCTSDAVAKYGPMYNELYSTIAQWRAGKPTILVTLNRYNDWIGLKEGNLTKDQEQRTVAMHDAWNTMICEAAANNGFNCADVYHAFNGPQGVEPAGNLLAADYIHPSQQGHDRIESVLASAGFAPLT